MSLLGHRSIIRFIYFLGVIRWYNLLLIAVSQYLLSGYILLRIHEYDKKGAFWQFLTDTTVHGMALATLFTVAAIFIMNAFYDRDKDLVNRSNLPLMSEAVGTRHLANLYFIFNALGMLFALLASTKAAIYFLVFQFFGWFYSHKMQKIPVLREFTSSLLTLAPLWAIWVHFNFAAPELGPYFLGLMVVLFVKDLMKDLAGDKGNALFGYQTVAVFAGPRRSKVITWVIAFVSLISFGVYVLQLQKAHDMEWVTLIGLILTYLNVSLWQLFPVDAHIKWMLRLQKSVVLFYFGALLTVIIYRHVLFFVYHILVP
jgi:4-hydroxybenzoate polyprenyltransferase